MRKQRMKCLVLAAALVAVAAVAVQGTAGAASNRIDSKKPPVRFAMISIKIPGANVLDAFDAGSRAAAKAINAKGGFGGRKVEIETCNSMLQAAVATTCAQQTLANKPIAMIGCDPIWGSSGLKIYKTANVPSFNCSTSTADFNEPSNFALTGAARGQQRAISRWLCSRKDVSKVVLLTQDIPGQRADATINLLPLYNCGKKFEIIAYPIGTPDLTPFVNRAAQEKPDFVLTIANGVVAVNIFKLFKQAGIPGSRISITSSAMDYKAVLEPAQGALDGAYAAVDVKNWGNTKDPEVAAYRKAMQGASIDYRSTANLGYMPVMFFYEAAKRIGFDKFNSVTLSRFMNSKSSNGMHIPLSRSLIVKGTKASPQVRQPFSQIVQWKNNKLVAVKTGPNKDGWVNGF